MLILGECFNYETKKTWFILILCDVIGVQRDVIGVQRDVIGVQRDVIGAQRDVIGVLRLVSIR